MSDAKKDGGQAFPHLQPTDPQFAYSENGMSLRDWFAGQALAGMLANPALDRSYAMNLDSAAYLIADGLIAAREAKS